MEEMDYYTGKHSLCMQLSDNYLFWEMNLKRRNMQNSHLVCTGKLHYPFKNGIKCMKNYTESSRIAWCFNSCWAQEREGEGVSPAGHASMWNLVKTIPADLRLIRSVNSWTNSASSRASWLDSFMYIRSKIQVKPLHPPFSCGSQCLTHRQRSRCSLMFQGRCCWGLSEPLAPSLLGKSAAT